MDFPYTHDLARLTSDLEACGEPLPEAVLESRLVSTYAWVTRYPSLVAVTEEQYQRALAIAEAVVRWAGERITAVLGPE